MSLKVSWAETSTPWRRPVHKDQGRCGNESQCRSRVWAKIRMVWCLLRRVPEAASTALLSHTHRLRQLFHLSPQKFTLEERFSALGDRFTPYDVLNGAAGGNAGDEDGDPDHQTQSQSTAHSEGIRRRCQSHIRKRVKEPTNGFSRKQIKKKSV